MGINVTNSNAITTITLDRQEALNALTPALLNDLADALDAAAADPDVIATGNPGCLMQLEAGARRRALRARLLHVRALLEQARAVGLAQDVERLESVATLAKNTSPEAQRADTRRRRYR